jgi:hypothetical protein
MVLWKVEVVRLDPDLHLKVLQPAARLEVLIGSTVELFPVRDAAYQNGRVRGPARGFCLSRLYQNNSP